MGDLISRSQLLKEIENWGGCVEALQEYISNMPTAYDLEKVVGEIRNQPFGNYGVQEENEIIDIVKRGGET